MLAAKQLIKQAVNRLHPHQNPVRRGSLASTDLDIRIAFHYGIPSTASLLAYDAVQSLLAIATRDGRIKVIGGEGIEALLISPKPVPYKYLEFLENQGFLVGISNDDEIQVWNLESRGLACCLQWEYSITALSVINGSCFMYVGDELSSLSVVKFNVEVSELMRMPYQIDATSIFEAAGFPFSNHQSLVGILPHPFYFGNRVMIAYQCGLLILWDIPEDRIFFIGGSNNLQLKKETGDSQDQVDNLSGDAPDQLEKEVTALCWASTNGSILAVGYLDGDVLFWKIPTAISLKSGGHHKELPSKDVHKLQLSSAEKRIPVILLCWSQTKASTGVHDGQIFIYGGDQVGSEEVLTVLTLEWSSGMETLRCASRVDIKLAGSFADMTLFSSGMPTMAGGNHKDALFLLTNPGRLHFYDGTSLSALLSQQKSKTPIIDVEFPGIVPTSNPLITMAKLVVLPTGVDSPKIDLKASVQKFGSKASWPSGTSWPLSGGVPSPLSLENESGTGRIYMAGYQDGTVRLWDATTPVLSLICIAESQVQGVEVVGFNDPVSNLDFSFLTLTLAVGNNCGVVRIYKLDGSSNRTSFRFVTKTKNEDQVWPQEKIPHCRAIFSLVNSPISALQFANSGSKLAVGFECGQVVVLDMGSLSCQVQTNCISCSRSPVISLCWMQCTCPFALTNFSKHSETSISVNPGEEVLFFLTKEATVDIVDSSSGKKLTSQPCCPKKKSVAISMYVIEILVPSSTGGELLEESGHVGSTNDAYEHEQSSNKTNLHNDTYNTPSDGVQERLTKLFLLLCCEDSLRLYSAKNLILGNNKTIHKVKHAKPCYWTSIFKKDNNTCGVFLLFHNGLIEIRSFPDLDLVEETSLMSILRWNFMANLEHLMSSDNGEITLISGCELVCISLLSSKNPFRIPHYLPCLHDKVLAAAADASFSLSTNQKKKQGFKPGGILGGLVKGFKGRKLHDPFDISLVAKGSSTHLEGLFSKLPFSNSSPVLAESRDLEVAELDIDDIEIDEAALSMATTSSQEANTNKKGPAEKRTEREQLLGITDTTKPRIRTPEEIVATYRKVGDASSAASHAKRKLVERQEKLEGISRRTTELQSGAEDFASLANELVKVMENRKWWQI